MNIARQGTIVLGLTFLGQLLGFFREALFGKYFGTTYAFDAFTLTFSIILFVNSFLIVIPFFSIPTLAKVYSQENHAEFFRQLSQIAVLVLAIVAVIIAAGEMWAEKVVMYAASGFKKSSDTFNFSVFLMRVSVPILFLLALTKLLRSVLNLWNIFAVPALESIFFNVGIIATILFAWRWLDIKSPVSVSCGYYVGYFLFVSLCFWVFLKSIKLSFFWRIDFHTMKTIMGGFSLLLIATAFNFMNPLVLMWHASHLPEGAVSGLGYVNRIMSFSIANIVNSFLVVFLPMSAVAFAKNDMEHLKAETEKLLLNFFTISIFVSAFIILNGETIVRLIYGRGLFDENSVRLVSGLLYCYLPWVLFFPLSNVAVRIFYVYKDYRNLTIISAAGLLLTLMLAPFLRKQLGVNGLGLMSSFHMICYSSALLVVVHKRYFRIDFSVILKGGLVNATMVGSIVSVMLLLKASPLSNPYALLAVSLSVLGPVAFWRLNESLNLVSIFKSKMGIGLEKSC